MSMHVTDVSVGSCVDTGIVDILMSGPTELGRIRSPFAVEMDVETAPTLRDMLTDCIEHQDTGGHYPEAAE
jgi:hypothetical protein